MKRVTNHRNTPWVRRTSAEFKASDIPLFLYFPDAATAWHKRSLHVANRRKS
jgi:hypothetical protein